MSMRRSLKQDEGSQCWCGAAYWEHQYQCTRCGKRGLASFSFYKRFRIERAAVLATLLPVMAIIGYAMRGTDGLFFGAIGLAIVGIVGPSFYGGWTERFRSEAEIPARTYLTFAWKRYFLEFGIFIAAVVGVPLIGLASALRDIRSQEYHRGVMIH